MGRPLADPGDGGGGSRLPGGRRRSRLQRQYCRPAASSAPRARVWSAVIERHGFEPSAVRASAGRREIDHAQMCLDARSRGCPTRPRLPVRGERSTPTDAIDRPTSVHGSAGPSNSASHWGYSTHDAPLRDPPGMAAAAPGFLGVVAVPACNASIAARPHLRRRERGSGQRSSSVTDSSRRPCGRRPAAARSITPRCALTRGREGCPTRPRLPVRGERSTPTDAIDRPTSVHGSAGPSNSASHWGYSTHDAPLRDPYCLAVNDCISGAADRHRTGKGDEHHTSGRDR
jgi:hypothetical protein